MAKLPVFIKFLFLFLASSTVLAFPNLVYQAIFLVIISAAVLSTKEKFKIFGRVSSILPIGIAIVTLQFLLNPAIATLDKLLFSGQVIMRLVNISLIVFYFVAAVSPSEIASFFLIFSKDISLLMTMTFYFIPLIYDEAGKITAAQKSRGLKSFKWNIFPLVAPLLHRVFTRAQSLSLSIVSRGYRH